MNVLVTGGTGFIGSRLIERLLADEHVSRIVALHRGAAPSRWQHEKLVPLHGDLERLRTWAADVPLDAVVHLAGFWRSEDPRLLGRINYEGTQHVIELCQRCEVPRLIFTSSINVNLRHAGAYALSKRAAEAAVRRSKLRHVILRPTLVYGPGDTGLSRIVRAVDRSPFVPVFGDGTKLEQPIHIEELTEFLIQALHAQVADHTLEVGGRDALTFNDLVHTIARVRKRRVRLLHVPAAAALAATRTFEALALPFPITTEQIRHMDEDLPANNAEALSLFDVKLSGFEEHLRRDYG
jgi:nucleoside-diphosphate-sugar epimerase